MVELESSHRHPPSPRSFERNGILLFSGTLLYMYKGPQVTQVADRSLRFDEARSEQLL